MLITGIATLHTSTDGLIIEKDWFPDLLEAIEGILPTWAESYRIVINEEIEADSLTFTNCLSQRCREKAKCMPQMSYLRG